MPLPQKPEFTGLWERRKPRSSYIFSWRKSVSRLDHLLRGLRRSYKITTAVTTNAPCGAFVVVHAANAYQKNCRRASRMSGLSLTKLRALDEYFLLSTIT